MPEDARRGSFGKVLLTNEERERLIELGEASLATLREERQALAARQPPGDVELALRHRRALLQVETDIANLERDLGRWRRTVELVRRRATGE